jgi:hypothetical protein
MTLIVGFAQSVLKHPQTHRTQVVCYWSLISEGQARLIQLDTRGSADRQNPDRQSQTIQLDRRAAQEPVRPLTKEFGFV